MFIILITPLLILFSFVLLNDGIFNKFSYLITSTGYLAIIYLTITLLVPLLRFKNNLFSPRNIGQAAFYLSCLHLVLYIYDNNIDLNILIDDFIYRNYILSGYIAFFMFLPMYLTSFDFFKKIITNWKKIHKIIYMIYIATLAHIYFVIKADYFYLFIFIMLFFVSVIFKLSTQKRTYE